MRRITQRRLIAFLALSILFGAGASAHAIVFGPAQAPMLHRVVGAFTNGAILFGFLVFVVPTPPFAWIRRTPFPARALFYIVAVIVSVLLSAILVELVLGGRFNPMAGFRPGWTLFAWAAAITLLVTFIHQMSRMIGLRTLLRVVSGRYHQPITEKRIFLFIDLAGSTALAQQLGNRGVHRLLSRFFFDLADPIQEWGGEIHSYVGDEVIVTWPIVTAERNARAAACFFAARALLARKAEAYRRAFGTVPRIRGALHGGAVTVGEIGDLRATITYFGDVINTTARLEAEAKTRNCDPMASADYVAMAALPDRWRRTAIGKVDLKGRQEPLDLVALEEEEAQ